MKRTAQALALAAALSGGCVTDSNEQFTNSDMNVAKKAKTSTAIGPWGEPVTAMSKKNNDSGIQQVNHEGSRAAAAPRTATALTAVPVLARRSSTSRVIPGCPRPAPSMMAGAVAATGAIVGPGGPGGHVRSASRWPHQYSLRWPERHEGRLVQRPRPERLLADDGRNSGTLTTSRRPPSIA